MSTTSAEHQTDLVQPTAPDLHPPGTPTSGKKKRKPRATLTPQHMSTLIASYRMHYANYSSSRESVTQLVPSSVWKKVYTDFIALYPEASSFDNEHLKSRVRNALKELETPGNSSVADLVQQHEQILKRLKMTGASPLMQQILWRNHNAEISSQQKPAVAVTVKPISAEKPPDAPAVAPSLPTTDATPSSIEGDVPDGHHSQPMSTQPSQLSPRSLEFDSDDGAAKQNGAANGNPLPSPVAVPTTALAHLISSQELPAMTRPAPTSTVSSTGKKAMLHSQTTALCKLSADFTKACAGIMEFLEFHKAKAKQEEAKVMLANYEKACNMGVITFEEMKSKTRSLLDI